jgi:8-oxo-dGTP diphosphatase
VRIVWAYVIAFTDDLKKFVMVRSRKRGGWEMPGGRGLAGETPYENSRREFLEETGHELISGEELCSPLEDGFVFFGRIGPGDFSRRSTREISDVSLFSDLPEDLAYPLEEYSSLIDLGRHLLS